MTTIYNLTWTIYEDPLRPYTRRFNTREEALKYAQSLEGAKTITLYTEILEEMKIQ